MTSTKVIHRFIRNANLDSNIYNRVANRFDPFKNTLVTLEDPANNRTLTLIGSTNSSTTLAQRTQNLLEKLNPDAVYVQASQEWWNYAKHTNVVLKSCRLRIRNFLAKLAKTSQNNSIASKITFEGFSFGRDISAGKQCSRAAYVYIF